MRQSAKRRRNHTPNAELSRRVLLRSDLGANNMIGPGPALWKHGSHAASPRSPLATGCTGLTSKISNTLMTPLDGVVGNVLCTRVRTARDFSLREVARSGRDPIAVPGNVCHGEHYSTAVFGTPDRGCIYFSNAEVSVRRCGGALNFEAGGTLIDAYPIRQGASNNCGTGPHPCASSLKCDQVGLGTAFECSPMRAQPPSDCDCDPTPPVSAIRSKGLNARIYKISCLLFV